MNISKKAKIILFICCVFLLLSAGVFTTIHFVQTSQEISTERKLIHPISPIWIGYDIDSASEAATTIVYGTLGPKGEVKRNEMTLSNGELYVLERYREAEIQVIQMIKGDMDAETVHYWELSGEETDDAIYVYDDAICLEEGKSYLFFLNENGAYLSPATVMEVDEDGVIVPPWDMKIESAAQARSNHSLPVSLEDYLAEVQQNLD
jgi:hypothetical protein